MASRSTSVPATVAAIGPARPVRSPWVDRAMRPIGWLAVAVLVAGVLLAGLPAATPRRVALLVVLAAEVVLLLIAVSGRIQSRPVLAAVLVGSGFGGSALDLLQPSGPGFLGAYVAMAGIGLALRPRVAAVAGLSVLITAAAAEGSTSSQPVLAVLNLSLGALFLFVSSAFAAVSRDAQARAEALAAEEQALRQAREQAAVLAERGRVARELHDILAG